MIFNKRCLQNLKLTYYINMFKGYFMLKLTFYIDKL